MGGQLIGWGKLLKGVFVRGSYLQEFHCPYGFCPGGFCPGAFDLEPNIPIKCIDFCDCKRLSQFLSRMSRFVGLFNSLPGICRKTYAFIHHPYRLIHFFLNNYNYISLNNIESKIQMSIRLGKSCGMIRIFKT